MRTLLVLPLLLSACAEPVVATTEPTAATCDVNVLSTSPTNGATDAYFRGEIAFHLSAADPTATVIAPFDGVQTTRNEGTTIVFTPTSPLAPDTDYSVALDYCHGQPTIHFRTSPLGESITDIGALVGRTYAIDPSKAIFVAGEGVARVAAGLFDRGLLVSVVAAEEDHLSLRLGVADESGAVQDFCWRTVDLEVDFSQAPTFVLHADTMDVAAWAAGLSLSDLDATGTVSPDLTEVGGVTMEATIDLRQIATALEMMDGDEMCGLADRLGVPCEACPSDGADACVRLEAAGLGGLLVPGMVEAIAEADTDPRCPVEE